MTYAVVNSILEALGFSLGDTYWWKYGASDVHRAVSCAYEEEKRKAMALILNTHMTARSVISLNRGYVYEKLGARNEKCQAVVCIDIDGRNNDNTQEVIDHLAGLFSPVKFIEYSPLSNGYHLYFHFVTPVFDEQLRNMEMYFKELGYIIEAVRSTGHIRLPFSDSYSVFGLYAHDQATRVASRTLESLLGHWATVSSRCAWDPSLEVPRFTVDVDFPKRKKGRVSVEEILKNEPSLDYGRGERFRTVNRIVYWCVTYGLSFENFTEIAEGHDKGAKEKTDYEKLYTWATNKYPVIKKRTYRVDYTDQWDRIASYSTLKELPQILMDFLEHHSRATLIPFLLSKKNISSSGTIKNEELAKERWLRRVCDLMLHLLRYDEARYFEWDHEGTPEVKLPSVFDPAEGIGIPLPQSYLAFIGSKLKNSYIRETKLYLEQIGLLRPVDLNARGATYAQGRCVHYVIVRRVSIPASSTTQSVQDRWI